MGNGGSQQGSGGLSITEVQYEPNPWTRTNPTIRLTWQKPDFGQYSPRDVEFVVYANDKEVKVALGGSTGVTLKTLEPLKEYTFRVVIRHRVTKEEGLYYQEFQAFLDWKCKRLDCEQTRWVITDPMYVPEGKNSLICDYCSVQDKVVWEVDHCIHKECRRAPAPNSFFCDNEHDAHRYLAKQNGECHYVMFQPSSQMFKEMEKIFHKHWEKGHDLTPTVCVVIAIVNPYLEDRMTAYKSTLRRGHQKTEFHFHGTVSRCPLHQYYLPCQQKKCAICSISQNGFLLEYVRPDCKHFATAFYLAPSSSKCHASCATPISDEDKGHRNTYYTMVYCEVAVGNKYHLKNQRKFTSGPPDGYHTVYGKSSHMPFLHGDSKNEEIVVFNEDAICPKYIICYKTS